MPKYVIKSWIGKKIIYKCQCIYSLSKVWLIRRENKHRYPKNENERMFWRKSFFYSWPHFVLTLVNIHKWCPTFRGHILSSFGPNSRCLGVILDHPLKSDIIYGSSLDDLSLLSYLLSHLNLSKWAWLFNVCPCFCVGEVLYFFTFHWLLLPLTFLWVTPHTAEPLWEFFPTLWSHNTTAWPVV